MTLEKTRKRLHLSSSNRRIGAAGLPHPHISAAWYSPLFFMLFSVTIIFSVLDLFLTSVALNIGLSESNYFLLAISNYFGISLLSALGVTKIIFVSGGAIVSSIGLRTRDPGTRRRAARADGNPRNPASRRLPEQHLLDPHCRVVRASRQRYGFGFRLCRVFWFPCRESTKIRHIRFFVMIQACSAISPRVDESSTAEICISSYIRKP